MHKNGNNANIGIRGLATWKQKIPQNVPPVNIETGPLMNLWFQVHHSPFWTNLGSACKTETLGSLCSYALLILTKSSKSKNQVLHEQK